MAIVNGIEFTRPSSESVKIAGMTLFMFIS